MEPRPRPKVRLSDNPQAISNIHRSYLDGTRLRDGLMKEFVEDVGEFNPHEITEEQSKQAEKEAEQKQAAEGTFLFLFLTMSTNDAGMLGSCVGAMASRIAVQERRWQKKFPSKPLTLTT